METPQTSNEAVQKSTGKSWDEWFQILDAAGGQTMDHKGIVAYLKKHYSGTVSAWWQQMVTVTYEQARGLRARHEMKDGYQISRSKTFNAPLALVYLAWADESQRQQWLNAPPLQSRGATPEKTVRFRWVGEDSRVEVRCEARSETKTSVTVQHSRLPDSGRAEEMKSYWSEALDQLSVWLDSRSL